MIEARYWFLFGLTLVWMIFAVVQDLRRREISNWLNFSLVGFALAYRAFYSAFSSDWMFLAYGIMGFVLFYALANLFYYSKVLGGGDAKLLISIGAVLPFESYLDLVLISGSFVVVLLTMGAVYSLVWSVYITAKNYREFGREFARVYNNRAYRMSCVFTLLLFLVFGLVFFSGDYLLMGLVILFPLVSLFLFAYLWAVDKSMIRLVSPGKLTEGDWIIEDIKLKGYVVRKTVHGLSMEDILKLRKARKKVYIKEGIPFAPVFLVAFLFMVFFSGALLSLVSALFS